MSYRVLGVCFLLVALTSSPGYAQEASVDVFPRVTLGFSGGVFRPSLDELTEDHRKGAMVGGQVSLRLFEPLARHHVYGTAQLYSFGATRLGTGREVTGSTLSALVKWDMRTLNVGARYAVNLVRGRDVSWVGAGVSSITLDRNLITSRRVRVNLLDFREERTVTRERFTSTSYYIEVGQMVQSLAFNARPRVGLFWTAKYDGGRSETKPIGGLSIQVGALVGL